MKSSKFLRKEKKRKTRLREFRVNPRHTKWVRVDKELPAKLSYRVGSNRWMFFSSRKEAHNENKKHWTEKEMKLWRDHDDDESMETNHQMFSDASCTVYGRQRFNRLGCQAFGADDEVEVKVAWTKSVRVLGSLHSSPRGPIQWKNNGSGDRYLFSPA